MNSNKLIVGLTAENPLVETLIEVLASQGGRSDWGKRFFITVQRIVIFCSRILNRRSLIFSNPLFLFRKFKDFVPMRGAALKFTYMKVVTISRCESDNGIVLNNAL